MDSPQDELVPTSARPLPLRCRCDLDVETTVYHGERYFVVRDPLAMRYYRLTGQQHALLTLLDGRRNLWELRRDLQREFPTFRPALPILRRLIADLHAKGLAVSERAGQGEVLLQEGRKRRRQERIARVKNVFFIRLPGWDPDAVLTRLSGVTRWAFHPAAAVLMALFVVTSWIVLALHSFEFSRELPELAEFFNWPNLAAVWITIGMAKLLHELGHGLACRRFGGECHEIGVAFLVFSPCLYCDVSDTWRVADKWKRMAVSAAGMAVELVLSAVALWTWWLTEPGWLHQMAMNVFLVTSFATIVFNANPLLRYDGYYILCDLVELPNLRAKADAELRRLLVRWCWGVELPAASSDRRPSWLAGYAFAAWCYRWALLFGIAAFLYHALQPYRLEFVGVVLVFVSIGMGSMQSVRGFKQEFESRRRSAMDWRRITCSTAVFGFAVVACLFVPLPIWLEAPLVVEPDGLHPVYVRTGGELIEVLVKPGQRVKKGDVLLRLGNFSKEELYHRLRVARETQAVETRVQQLLGDLPREELSAGALAGLDRELADYAEQIEQLTIVAPCDGLVVPGERVAKSSRAGVVEILGTWTGTPLERRNLGCFLAAGTHLLSIAPSEQFVANLLIEPSDREDFRVGQPVRLKLSSAANVVLRSEIRAISERQVPAGGGIPSEHSAGRAIRSQPDGGSVPGEKAAYQATVRLDAPPALLQTSFRGRARVIVANRSLAELGWRSLRQTFVFLW